MIPCLDSPFAISPLFASVQTEIWSFVPISDVSMFFFHRVVYHIKTILFQVLNKHVLLNQFCWWKITKMQGLKVCSTFRNANGSFEYSIVFIIFSIGAEFHSYVIFTAYHLNMCYFRFTSRLLPVHHPLTFTSDSIRQKSRLEIIILTFFRLKFIQKTT